MATLVDARRAIAGSADLRAALLCTVALLLYGNLVSIPGNDARESFLLWANLAAAIVLLLWALAQRFTIDELGLAWRSVPASAAFGGVLSIAAALPPVAFILLAPLVTGAPIENEGTDRSGLDMTYFLLLRQPAGTALFEELAFRGVLYGAWVRADGERLAFAATSIAFAGWHLVITSKTVAESGVVESPPAILAGVVVSLAGLFVGGLIFAYLRWKTSSIAAPAVAHWLVVALMATAVWAVR